MGSGEEGGGVRGEEGREQGGGGGRMEEGKLTGLQFYPHTWKGCGSAYTTSQYSYTA